jgi:hypothetical protein
MLKRFVIVATLGLLVTLTAVASDREDDVNRTHKAAQVFKEIMNTPDQGIPQDLLESAKCIAIIPGDVKFAFIFGGSYGRGLATCRTGSGWSAPVFLAIGSQKISPWTPSNGAHNCSRFEPGTTKMPCIFFSDFYFYWWLKDSRGLLIRAGAEQASRFGQEG